MTLKNAMWPLLTMAAVGWAVREHIRAEALQQWVTAVGAGLADAAVKKTAEAPAPSAPVMHSAREGASSSAPQAALEAAVAPLRDQVVVSYGTVAEMGRQLGRIVQGAEDARRLGATKPEAMTPADRERWLALERQKSSFEGMLPEIAAMQDRPEEYGAFFAHAFQDAAELSAGDAARVEAYMRGRAVLMNAAGLNQSREPTDSAARSAWEEQRDGFNEDTMNGLLSTLPAGTAGRLNLDEEFLEYLEMDFDKASGVTKK